MGTDNNTTIADIRLTCKMMYYVWWWLRFLSTVLACITIKANDKLIYQNDLKLLTAHLQRSVNVIGRIQFLHSNQPTGLKSWLCVMVWLSGLQGYCINTCSKQPHSQLLWQYRITINAWWKKNNYSAAVCISQCSDEGLSLSFSSVTPSRCVSRSVDAEQMPTTPHGTLPARTGS